MVSPLFYLGLCLLFLNVVSGSQEPLIYQGVGNIDHAERFQESLVVTTFNPVSAISLDYASGNVQWRLDLRRSGSVQAMTISEKLALVLMKEHSTQHNCFVFAVNPSTGSLLWEIEVNSSDSENMSLAYSKASSRVVVGDHLSMSLIENALSSNPILQKVNLPTLSCDKFVIDAADITANQIQVGSCFAAKEVYQVVYNLEKKAATTKLDSNLPFFTAQFLEQSALLEVIKNKQVVSSQSIDPIGQLLSSESFVVTDNGAHLPVLHAVAAKKNCIFSVLSTGNNYDVTPDCILNYPNGPKLFIGKRYGPNNQISKVSVYHVQANQQKPEFKITLKKQVSNYPHYEVLIPAALSSHVSNLFDVSKDERSIELLILLNNGISALIVMKDDKTRVEWLRNDGLSRLKHSMIVSTSSNSTDVEDTENSFLSAFDWKNLVNIGDFVHSSSEKSSCRMHQHLLALSHNSAMKQLSSASGLLIHLLELKPTLCGKAHIITWRPNFPADVLLDLDTAQLLPHYESSIKGKTVNGFTLVIHSKDTKQTNIWRVSLPYSSKSHYSSSSRYFKNDFYDLQISSSFDGSENYVTSIASSSDIVLQVHNLEENLRVLASPSTWDILPTTYFHTVNVDAGSISIQKIGKRSCDSHSTRTCRDADHVSTIQFDPQTERISLVLHPSTQTGSSSRTTILGDDNVLLNYINPNLMVVCTLAQSSEAPEDSKLYVNLVDVISGKLLHRIVHDNAVGPVRGVIVDNFVLVAFWNNKAKRSEISSIGLYDGFIGKNDFTPFSYESKSKSDEALTFYKAQNVTHRSSFFTVAPLIMQRTYSLTRGIADITRTISAKGINNKNILLVLDSGQIYSLDFRVLSPRRPLSDPTQSEKEEGLIKYGPHIPLFPTAAVTKSKALAFDGSIKILSSAAHLESESFVVAHGESGDLFIDIFTPAQAFDSLSRDFNFPALIGLLLLLAVCVFILRQLNRRTTLQRLWH